MYIRIHIYTRIYIRIHVYGMATMSRLLKIIGLFCRISSLLHGTFAKETSHFKEPTNRGHPISTYTPYSMCRGMCVCVRGCDTYIAKDKLINTYMRVCIQYICIHMGWLRLVGSIKL